VPAGLDRVVVSLAPNGSEVGRVTALYGGLEKAAIGLCSPDQIAIAADLRPTLLPPPDPARLCCAFPRFSGWSSIA
jgi:hypothetical protein